jgi:RNA polymerase sigma-70 factor (ECF subfamily)
MDTASKFAGTEDREQLCALLRSVAGGNRDALAGVYQRTSAKLYGICLRLLREDRDAQDVLQEVYLTVWRSAGQFDESKASPITWLAVLARNKCIDRLRRRTIESSDLDDAAEVQDDSKLAPEVIEEEQEARRLHQCLEELEDRTSAMIRSAFFEGITYAQLAERELVPLGTMKSLIRRGLLRLRGCLGR